MSDKSKIELKTQSLLGGVRGLFEQTQTFTDEELKGACHCLLAAAVAVGDDKAQRQGCDMSKLVVDMQAAQDNAGKNIVELIRGNEISLGDTASFFALFHLSETLKISACQEICKMAVTNNVHSSLPIKLQCPSMEWSKIRKVLRSWHLAKPALHTDAIIKLRKPMSDKDNAADQQQYETISVHAFLFAAVFDYMRALWAGGFREGEDKQHCYTVEDASEAHVVKTLVDVVYGGTPHVSSKDLASCYWIVERLQSEDLRSQLLDSITRSLTAQDAHELLAQTSPLPQPLLQCGLKVIEKAIVDLQDMNPLGALCKACAVPTLHLQVAMQILAAEFVDTESALVKAASNRLLSALAAAPLNPQLERLPWASLGSSLSHLSAQRSKDEVFPCKIGAKEKVSWEDLHNCFIFQSCCAIKQNEPKVVKVVGPAQLSFTRVVTDCPFHNMKVLEFPSLGSPPATGKAVLIPRGRQATIQVSSYISIEIESVWTAKVLLPEIPPQPSKIKPQLLDLVELSRPLSGADAGPGPAKELSMGLLRMIANCNLLNGLAMEVVKPMLEKSIELHGFPLIVALLSDSADCTELQEFVKGVVCPMALPGQPGTFGHASHLSQLWYSLDSSVMRTLLDGLCACENAGGACLPEHVAAWAKSQASDCRNALWDMSRLASASSSKCIEAAICRCIIDSGDAELACIVLNEVFGKVKAAEAADQCEPPAKRTKTSHPQNGRIAERDALNPVSKEAVGAGLMAWCKHIKEDGGFGLLGCSSSWVKLQPPALLQVARVVARKDFDDEEVPKALSRWVEHASIDEVFEALALAVGSDATLAILHKSVKSRLVAAEKQNALLEGGKFRDELSKAVEASNAEVESRLKKERDASETALRQEFARIEKRRMEGLQQSLKSAVDQLFQDTATGEAGA